MVDGVESRAKWKTRFVCSSLDVVSLPSKSEKRKKSISRQHCFSVIYFFFLVLPFVPTTPSNVNNKKIYERRTITQKKNRKNCLQRENTKRRAWNSWALAHWKWQQKRSEEGMERKISHRIKYTSPFVVLILCAHFFCVCFVLIRLNGTSVRIMSARCDCFICSPIVNSLLRLFIRLSCVSFLYVFFSLQNLQLQLLLFLLSLLLDCRCFRSPSCFFVHYFFALIFCAIVSSY